MTPLITPLIAAINSLEMQGNRWQAKLLDTSITQNSILEFDFQATKEGEIHGIGFDSDDAISDDLTFQLFGTQDWGIRDFDYSGAGEDHFVIPVGQYFTGEFNRLTFILDDDANADAEHTFSNIRIYEKDSVVSDTYYLEAGSHTLTVYGGEADAAIDLIGVTDDLSLVANDGLIY